MSISLFQVTICCEPKKKEKRDVSSSGLTVQPATNLPSSLYCLNVSAPELPSSNSDGKGDFNIDYAVRAEEFLDGYSEVFYLDGDDEFDTNTLGVVCSQYPYGYLGDTVSPCIFLTLTDIENVEPDPITEEDFDARSFPFSPSFRTFWESQSNKEQVFIDCCSTSDIEIQYFPASRGFETKYFPITDDSNVPIVAIQISGLSLGKHDVQCRAYYKGVKFTNEDKYKSVINFTLEMITAVK